MHFILNVWFHATDRFLSSGCSSGGAWEARELRSEFAVYMYMKFPNPLCSFKD